MVANYYKDLYQWLGGGSPTQSWDIPADSFDRLSRIRDRAMTPDEARDYHVYHDCGKHLSFFQDDEGRRHFPGHADHSRARWLECGGDPRIAHLIKHDMVFHTAKGDDLKAAVALQYSETLILTAWAEIHANASMFGGLHSESFKIKRKRLVKATKLFAQAE